MYISKKNREIVRWKYDNKCAYTGTILLPDWQVDHMESKVLNSWLIYKGLPTISDINDIFNLIPAQRIVNHYKRGFDLEGFRLRMLDFHLRLRKLPKEPTVKASINRKAYMLEVARLFDITTDKPFSGHFYFETL